MKHLIIGMGSIGGLHYHLLQEAGEEVIGVDKGFAYLISDLHDFKYPPSVKDMWEWCGMVWICTPTQFHYEYTKEALLNNVKNIFIEKPITQNLTQFEIIKNYSGKRVDGYQPKIWSACNYRFHPAVKILKDNLAQVGKILYSRMHFSHYLPYQRENWQEYMKDTNIIMDVGWHFVDLALWLFGNEYTYISKKGGFINTEFHFEDCQEIQIGYGTYAPQVWIHLDYLRRDKSWGIEVVGTEGTLTLHGLGREEFYSVILSGRKKYEVIFHDVLIDPDEMYRNQLNYLLKEDWESNINEQFEVLKICVS